MTISGQTESEQDTKNKIHQPPYPRTVIVYNDGLMLCTELAKNLQQMNITSETEDYYLLPSDKLLPPNLAQKSPHCVYGEYGLCLYKYDNDPDTLVRAAKHNKMETEYNDYIFVVKVLNIKAALPHAVRSGPVHIFYPYLNLISKSIENAITEFSAASRFDETRVNSSNVLMILKDLKHAVKKYESSEFEMKRQTEIAREFAQKYNLVVPVLNLCPEYYNTIFEAGKMIKCAESEELETFMKAVHQMKSCSETIEDCKKEIKHHIGSVQLEALQALEASQPISEYEEIKKLPQSVQGLFSIPIVLDGSRIPKIRADEQAVLSVRHIFVLQRCEGILLSKMPFEEQETVIYTDDDEGVVFDITKQLE